MHMWQHNIAYSLLVTSLVMIPSAAAAQVADNVSPQTIGTIEVQLRDRTSSACWNNLQAVQEYAEEKLVAAGYQVVSDNAEFQLRVVVSGDRDERLFGQDYCSGGVRLFLGTGMQSRGIVGAFVVADMTTILSISQRQQVLDAVVIQAIDTLVDAM